MDNDYGYPKAFRDQVLRDADMFGVAAAAAKHNVGKSSVYRWRDDRDLKRLEMASKRSGFMTYAAIALVGLVAVYFAASIYLG